MLFVGDHLFVEGSYISAESSSLLPDLDASSPPTIITFPSGSNVADAHFLGSIILFAYDHLFSFGSYNSEELSSVPPVISTRPLLSNIAVWPSPLG